MTTLATLYELTDAYQRILGLARDDEDPEAWSQALDDLADSIEAKADGYAKMVRVLEAEGANLRAQAQPFIEEGQRLQAQAKGREARIADLKARLMETMTRLDMDKLQAGTFRWNVQRNSKPTVEVDDLAAVPDDYYRIIREPDRNKIAEAGEPVPGTRLTWGKHLRLR